MSWRGLRYKGTERLTSREWNAVVDALNDLYGFLTSGLQDIYVDEVYGRAGYFSEQVLVQGRPVIKDGDPISIYQFYDLAKQQITEAIDRSRATAVLEAYAPKLATIEEYTRESRDVLVRLRIDEYGNVGVKIAEPVDEHGYVQTTIASDRANLAKEQTLQSLLKHLVVEEKKRCWDVVVDDVFAVPEGSIWYVKSIYVTTGELYVDGAVKVV